MGIVKDGKCRQGSWIITDNEDLIKGLGFLHYVQRDE
jgi:hypothetical protein